MPYPRKQTEAQRREHLQTLVMLGALIIRLPAQNAVERQFVVFSAS